MKSQTFALRLFRLACSDAARFKDLSNFIISSLKFSNGIKVQRDGNKIVVCEGENCSKNVTINYSGKVYVSYNSKDLLKLVTSIVVKFLATDGVKKIVLLFRKESGDTYSKVSTRLRPCESSAVKVAAHAPMFSFLLSIVVALVVIVLYHSILLSLLAAAVSSVFVTILFTSVLVSKLRLIGVEGLNLLKVEIWYRIDAPESRVNALLRFLKSVDTVSGSIEDFFRTVAETILGEHLVKVRLCNVELRDPVRQVLKRNRIRLLLVHSEHPEAFSLVVPPVCKYIVLTTKLVALLEPDEVHAVIAHEVGHIVNRDHVHCLLFTLLNAVVVYCLYLIVTTFTFPLSISFLLFLGYIVSAMFLARHMARKAEHKADRYAISVVGPRSLMMALIRVAWRSLVAELNSGVSYIFSKIFSSHPPVIDRLMSTMFSL